MKKKTFSLPPVKRSSCSIFVFLTLSLISCVCIYHPLGIMAWRARKQLLEFDSWLLLTTWIAHLQHVPNGGQSCSWGISIMNWDNTAASALANISRHRGIDRKMMRMMTAMPTSRPSQVALGTLRAPLAPHIAHPTGGLVPGRSRGAKWQHRVTAAGQPV